MKKFSVNCDFGGEMHPFAIYIGTPKRDSHPLHFQADWLSKTRGGMIPAEIMDSVSKLQKLAEKNNVSLAELCVYALGSSEDGEDVDDYDEDDDDEDEDEDEDDDDEE